MLELVGISKSFGSLKAVDAISLAIREGECFGLLGPNGAGKTTLVNLISGLLSPDSGEVVLFGQSHRSVPPQVRKEIGVAPQEIALYENLSVQDNLKYFGELYGLWGKRLSGRIDRLLEWARLRERKKEKVKVLSGGMKRRVNLIAGLLHSPRLLLVDEPTAGIDPQARTFIYDLIRELTADGIAVLYTTHYIHEAELLCKRVAILDQGKMAAIGTREEILASCGVPEYKVEAARTAGLEAAFFRLTGKELRE